MPRTLVATKSRPGEVKEEARDWAKIFLQLFLSMACKWLVAVGDEAPPGSTCDQLHHGHFPRYRSCRRRNMLGVRGHTTVAGIESIWKKKKPRVKHLGIN